MKKLNASKGFSLIELLVVIAIIGILSAVGITTYTGYTANAKKQAATAQYASVLSLLNAEEAKCASGTGNYVWGQACGSASAPSAITYMNDTLGMKNPFKPAQNAVAASVGTNNNIGLTYSGSQWTITADIDGDGSAGGADDKSITTVAY
jgi:type IV pilus assembly protein PilA